MNDQFLSRDGYIASVNGNQVQTIWFNTLIRLFELQGSYGNDSFYFDDIKVGTAATVRGGPGQDL
jgi:uncharacterized protein YkuJ